MILVVQAEGSSFLNQTNPWSPVTKRRSLRPLLQRTSRMVLTLASPDQPQLGARLALT